LTLIITAATAAWAADGHRASGAGDPRAEKPDWILEAERSPIDMDDFADRLLTWTYFKAAAAGEECMVIDVRGGFLEYENLPGLDLARPISLDVFIPNFVARRAHRDKTLLILDEDGSHLRVLQYHLQKHGYDNYFFLEGGSEWTLKILDQRS
jgi:hypothetical protein